ncbi:MAG: response regulator transcription factor [Ignavibacteria bacterium]|nr:response regulator transcription factor [Ignavibacteria bacterium]
MKLLVIEDEKKVASFIKKGLEEEYYTVDTAPNGKIGLEMALEGDYDLIILDYMLPFKDGLTVTRDLRSEKFAKPILMLTAKDKIQDKVECLDAGADDYLTKPFAFEELIARIRALLRRAENEKSNLLKIHEFSLDTQSHKLHVGNSEIELTPKEYSIFEFLVRNKNKVVSRTRLTQHIYEYQFDTDTNVIDVYINKLRGKIEPYTSDEVIQTVRGIGYIVKD